MNQIDEMKMTVLLLAFAALCFACGRDNSGLDTGAPRKRDTGGGGSDGGNGTFGGMCTTLGCACAPTDPRCDFLCGGQPMCGIACTMAQDCTSRCKDDCFVACKDAGKCETTCGDRCHFGCEGGKECIATC